MKLKSRPRFCTNLFLTSALAIGGSFSLAKSALAQLTPAGTPITNTATGSFEGNTTPGTVTVTSNTVTLSVQEIAGITVVSSNRSEPTKALLATEFSTITPGPYQGVEGINNSDIVYFDFTITNTGNSPTAFYIPNTATVTGTGGGTFQGIAVTAVDPDGAGSKPTTPFAVPKAVPSAEADKITTSTNFLGATDGYIPIGGTVTVRVAVKLTGVAVGDITKVVLGGQNTAGTSVNGGENFVANGSLDLYTSDLTNGTAVPNTGYTANGGNAGYAIVVGIDQTLETNGNPVNGDAVFFRREASAEDTTAITAGTDYGDAPDTFKTLLTVTGTGSTASYANSGASQIIDATNIKLGANAPDAEATGAAVTSPASANSPNGDGADEDGVTLPALTTSTTTYTATVNVTNNTGLPAYLVGWIDFNGNGVFDNAERVAYTSTAGEINAIPTGTSTVTLTWTGLGVVTSGVKYARFRLTTDTKVLGGLGIDTQAGPGAGTALVVGGTANSFTAASVNVANNNNPFTPLGKGEVEDYSINVGAVPSLNVVKRITNINGVDITDEIRNATLLPSNPADAKWPTDGTIKYLRGAINCTIAAPCNGGAITGAKAGDLVEYTIYFLANGTDALKNVKICDRIPTNTTFEPDTYGATGSGLGILLGLDTQSPPTALPNPANSTLLTNIKTALTNDTADAPEFGAFYPSSTFTSLPATLSTACGGTTNANGTAVVDLGAATVVPFATVAGTPFNSYGFIRFKVKVN